MNTILLSTLNAKYIHSSLALRYLKAFCENEISMVIKIKEFSINEFAPEIIAGIFRQQPDILCFSCYIWNIRPILDICHDYKKISPRTIIVLGGPEVSYDSSAVLQGNSAVDFIVRGEGEATFKELLSALTCKESVHNIYGITYRHEGEIYQTPDRPLISDLDEIPFPYPQNLRDFHDKIVYYESSRGCPFNCSYCLSSTLRGVRYFSLERVKNDLSLIMDQQVREVKFVDRTFNCHETRAIEIMRYIIENQTRSKFHFELDASLISKEMLTFLKNVPADLFNFEIGIQSTHLQTLEEVHRKMDWLKIESNIKTLQSYGNIHLHLDLIAGLPYENYNQFKQSFNNVFKLHPDQLQLGFLKLLKGSPIRAAAEKHQYVFEEQPPYQVLANQYMNYEDLLVIKDIEDLLEKYHNSGDMQQSVAYIMSSIYDDDAFTFFEEFSNYWRSHDFFEIGHKKDRLYTFLISFIAAFYPEHQENINELLKNDYFWRNRSDVLPEKLWSYNPPEVNQEIYKLIKDDAFMQENLPEFAGKSPREIKKNLHLEYLRRDCINSKLLDYAKPILFVYDPIKKKACKKIHL